MKETHLEISQRLHRWRKKNTHKTKCGELEIFYSYSTPMLYRIGDQTYVRDDYRTFSVTTTQHVHKELRYNAPTMYIAHRAFVDTVYEAKQKKEEELV